MHSRSTSFVSSVVAAVLFFGACGGGSDDGSSTPSTPENGSGVNVPDPTGTGPATPIDAPASNMTPFVSAGTPTGLSAGAGATSELSATIDGTSCTADDPLASCLGAIGSGGPFVVTVENDPDDFSIRTVGVRCGLTPAVATATVTGEQLVVLGQLSFAEFGGVIGVARYGAGDEAFLVYQPTGSSCPEVFGLGPIQPNSIMQGGNEVVGITRPDGSLACVVADGSGAFAISEAQDACPL